ncbi:hypothetical protein C0584_05335 [Candidatus Parcubacteria bacterium]|nr:MAG: hypothetical protein C0584_05335 [Candidatus Parcubacteria bacterium]
MKINFNKKTIFAVLAVIILIVVFTKISNKNASPEAEETTVKTVATMIIGEDLATQGSIKTEGSVKADSNVSLISMQSATVKNINFEVGDTVFAGQNLISMSENAILTSLLNAQTDYSNKQNNLEIVKTSTDQDIKSSEINFRNAKEALELSKIQLKSAQDNYDNGIIQIEKGKADLKNNAVITYNNNLSALFDILDQIDYIIKEDGEEQIAGIENVLAVKNRQSLTETKSSYRTTRTCYDTLAAKQISAENIQSEINESISCLQKAKIAIDNLIIALENTISSQDFSEATLNSQISKFNQLRLSVLGTEANTKSTEQALENIEINAKADKDRLDNALALAKNQLAQTEIAYESAELSLEKTKSLKEQQIVSAQIAKDSSLGQLNLARERAGDLYIQSPINGVVTKKSVQLGEEVSPGKVLGEVSQLGLVKIIVNLSSDEIYRIALGDLVKIEKEHEGTVVNIAPAADPLTKKVRIEIAYDNTNSDLIAETFVDVEFPKKKLETQEEGTFYIPLSSVTITQNGNYVFLNEDGKAKKQEVSIGRIDDALVEISSGLSNGMELIIEGNKLVENGDLIKTE